MRKAERLFQLITLLRGRRLAVTASKLAEILEVSERTIYRDIQALMLSGVPIEGEAGVGYRLDARFELPPLMFTSEELLALLVGSKMVQTWGDSALAVGANSALDKITAILPDKLKGNNQHSPIVVPDYFKNTELALLSQQLRSAITEQKQLAIEYTDVNQQLSQRTIEPLGLVYWGAKWTLVAYCQLRSAYREFRIDRIQSCQKLSQSFELANEKNLTHYLQVMEAANG
ncbi:DNA-binding transcriptional regulator [Thalassotalea insulae]|uniref:DNA-binding transcriptional regulator n=1 Tax=Thalassotalea insulae TaxID=2056778 RepID=A0ABQ6GQS3_9GAMM|nr:YafY family protein [Thalassotalea insulae]GLX78313.1 DNA-binding transcriptional regulator [Thalassotalea insulae]